MTTRDELFDLALRYASTIDRGDAEGLLAVFHPDARLRVFQPSEAPEPRSDHRGHDDLRRIPERIARFEKTFHFLGNARYDIGDREATGEVYCTAHHLTVDGDRALTYVMYIRYADVYRPDANGEWKIADR